MLRCELLAAMGGLGAASVLGAAPLAARAEEAAIPTIPGPDPNTRTHRLLVGNPERLSS